MNTSLVAEGGQPPYWRLSAFYFFYFSILGAMLPFWSLYLRETGFSLSEIGELMAILVGTKLLAPNIWGWIADRSGNRMGIIRLGVMLALLLFSGIFFSTGYWHVALVMAGYSFFWNAVLPQFEVVTLRHLGGQSDEYSRIRLWGSVGFVLAVVGLGWFFERYSVSSLPLILFILLGWLAISGWAVRSPIEAVRKSGGFSTFLQELKSPQVILFFCICFLMQVSHGPFYTFFSIFLEDYGYSKTATGWLWALGVICEIGVFMVAHHLVRHISIRGLVLSCLAIAAIRWWLVATYPDNLWLLVISQIGHAASFGIFHAVSIFTLHRCFSTPAAGQGQAMYSAFSFGLGGAVGAYLSGIVVEGWGASTAYYMAAAVALIACLLALFLTLNSDHKIKH